MSAPLPSLSPARLASFIATGGRGTNPERLPLTPTVADIIRQRNAAWRALKVFTDADKRLAQIADLCAEINWSTDACGSMHRVRREFFKDQFDGVPLCPLEDAAAFRHPNTAALVLGYGVFREAIYAQLEEMQKAGRRRAAALTEDAVRG